MSSAAASSATRIPRTPEGVLDFWLGAMRDVNDTSEARWRERMLRWRVGVFARAWEDADFSAAQRDLYEELHERGQDAVFSPREQWDTPRGWLAKLIVLDQLPRCVYRGTPLAYENDAQLIEMLQHICKQGWDRTEYNLMERLWVYVPLSHPEHRELQELSVQKWTQWSADLVAASPAASRRVNQRVGWAFVKAVIEHSEAVLVHGKFPHRNPILCRPHRAGEVHYLTSELRPPWSFTQPPRTDYYALHAALHSIERWADCRAIDRDLLRAWHRLLGLDPDQRSLMDVFDTLKKPAVSYGELYRHLTLSRNARLHAAAVTAPGVAHHIANVTRALFKDQPSSGPRVRVPRVIDVPALNLAVGCPLLDRGDVSVPRSAINAFEEITRFRAVPFKELYAGYQQLAADAERKSLVDDEPMHEGMRRRSPIERRAFEKLASRMFEPSPARDQVLATLYELLDLDYDGTVDAGEMLVALVALCSGSIDEKLSVCFQVFDADHSGRLDQAELADLVHTTLLRGLHVVEALFRNYLPEGSRESTELVTLFSLANFSAIEQVAQRALSEADADGDGRVDEAEFRAWAAKHPLLRQLLTLSQVLFGS